MDLSLIVVVVILTALAFDFTNGFHDTANAMATSIATKALKPRTAVIIAGVLNLIGAFLSVEVAKTISSGLVDDTKTIIVALVLVGLAAGIYAALRRRPINADNVNDVPAPKPVAVAA